VAGGIVVVGGALGLLIKGVSATVRGVRRAARAFDEVLGDGTEDKPGWGKRLERSEREGRELKETVSGIDRRLVRVEDVLTRMPVALRGDDGRVIHQAR